MTDNRTLLVSLSSLPLHVRLKAAQEAARHEPDPYKRLELRMRAYHPRPEHDLHWVSGDAVDVLRALRGEREAA